MKKSMKYTITLAMLAMISTGCFQMKDAQVSDGIDLSSQIPAPSNGEDPVIAGVLTAAFAGQTRLNFHYQNILKVTAPTAANVTKFTAKVGALTIDGVPKTLNAPALMASVDISSEYCEDLYDQENAAGAPKRFFTDVNLATGTAQFSATVLDSVIGKLARAAWQRAPATDERAALGEGVVAVQTGTTAADTKRVLMFLCTSVLASVDGQNL